MRDSPSVSKKKMKCSHTEKVKALEHFCVMFSQIIPLLSCRGAFMCVLCCSFVPLAVGVVPQWNIAGKENNQYASLETERCSVCPWETFVSHCPHYITDLHTSSAHYPPLIHQSHHSEIWFALHRAGVLDSVIKLRLLMALHGVWLNAYYYLISGCCVALLQWWISTPLYCYCSDNLSRLPQNHIFWWH